MPCLWLLCGSCSTSESPTGIRLINSSGFLMEDVVVRFPSATVVYGDIVPGRATEYRLVDQAYGYAYVEAMIEGRAAIIQPEDFVGEEPLGPGTFAYELSYHSSGETPHDRLRLRLLME